jgi:predicted Fe-Mo cluster-binding NifX family protein
MRVAIPIARGRVSPVFDTAGVLLVVAIDDGREVSRSRIDLQNLTAPDRVNRLTSSDVEVLLCGAISQPLYDMLEIAGIEVMPFLSGDVEVILSAYADKMISDPRFLMPGCGGTKRCRQRRRSNRRSGRKEAK